MNLTADQLSAAAGTSLMRASKWLMPIKDTCETFSITSQARFCMFIAQVSHESGRLCYGREVWGPTPAQLRYEGRADLGNTFPGDGFLYRGRGLLQITGRYNYQRTRDGLRKFLANVPDFEKEPEKLEEPEWAALSAGLYWHNHSLNSQADSGDIRECTRIINGGFNGLAERQALYDNAKKAYR